MTERGTTDTCQVLWPRALTFQLFPGVGMSARAWGLWVDGDGYKTGRGTSDPPPMSKMPLRTGGRRITRCSRALASERRNRMEHSPADLPNWPASRSATGHTIVVEYG